jgi:hypothetical protein
MKYLFKFGGTLSELLDAMSAVEFAADGGAKVYWKLLDLDLAPVVKGAWYTKGVLTWTDDESGFDQVLDLKADLFMTHASEMAFRSNLKKLIDDRIKKIAEVTKTDTEKVVKPAFYPTLTSDKPIWGRVMGYLSSIDSGVANDMILDMPVDKVLYGERAPFLPTVKGARDMVNKYLRSPYSTAKPGAPYILIADYEKIQVQHKICVPLPKGWQLIRVDEDVAPPEVIVALASHPLCRGVISWVGGISHAGWAADSKFILEFTDAPEDAFWSCAMTKAGVTLDLSSEQSTPVNVANSIGTMYKYAYDIELDDASRTARQFDIVDRAMQAASESMGGPKRKENG